MDTRKIEDVPFEEVHEIQRYGTYFSEKSFWKKIERVAKKVGATVLRPVFTLYYMLDVYKRQARRVRRKSRRSWASRIKPHSAVFSRK